MQQKFKGTKPKKTIRFLLLVIWLLAGITVSASQIQQASLVKQIQLNDTILNISPNTPVSLKTDENSQTLKVTIDPDIIEKLNLTQFHFGFSENKNITNQWDSIPFKQFEILGDLEQKLIIKSKNDKNEVFYTEIVLNRNLNSSSKTWILVVALAINFGLLIYFWSDYRIAKERLELEKEINKRTHELSEQQAKYEELLTNYLPKEEFEKLKEKDKTVRFKMVTVLFSNILGFTKIAEQENAEQLIDDLDRFFFEFDAVVKKLHIEKIKSVGDSYMCAGGIPQKNRTNPIEVVLAAFEMQQYMEMLKNQYISENKKIWDLRMGIHTGPVFSNSTTNKKRLEVWGDSVNIASRMEASGEIGKVNITGMTYELVKDYFLCQYRGKMPVKYKGDIDMYFIEGFRPALSVDGIGLKHNQTFVTMLGLIRFDDLEEHVMNILEDNLPKNLYYHNLKHTIDVTVQVELIGRQEGISDEELLILKTAALFHDIGFTRTYKDHEEAGVEFAKEILPDYDYTQEQIQEISEIIMATKLPPKPKGILQEIICDADLDYLGRVDFIPVSGNLFRELTEHEIIEDDINKWNQIQIDFIGKHSYFTETAKRLRDVNKNNQLEAIRSLVQENS